MQFDSASLIQDLQLLNRSHRDRLKELARYDRSTLNRSPDERSWSALQCVQHLILSLQFYIPEMARQIERASGESVDRFRSGWLGNYFAKSMWPSDRMLKTRTLERLVPDTGMLDETLLNQLDRQLVQLGELLEEALQIDLNSVRTQTLAGPWLKIKIGDGFRVVINHNERHLRQAQRALDHLFK